ncbi:helix-turn-helix domain-containing protein [Catalinimonas sp. 4WD22]|jgi:transposase|uniref:helix-turn-helix domain-containing protein n=1 Tax=Catalinimonas locisalis TaxID=3133978 RepID=UPI003101B30C
MIRIKFKEDEVEALKFERFHNASARIQQKMEALFLKSKGLPHNEICRICEISKTTLITYLREYQKGGIDKLKSETKYKGRMKEVKPTRMGYKYISEQAYA